MRHIVFVIVCICSDQCAHNNNNNNNNNNRKTPKAFKDSTINTSGPDAPSIASTQKSNDVPFEQSNDIASDRDTEGLMVSSNNEAPAQRVHESVGDFVCGRSNNGFFRNDCIRIVNAWLGPKTQDDEVLKRLGVPEKKNKKELLSYDSLYQQIWFYPSKGIRLKMKGKEKTSGMWVHLVVLTAPNDYKTPEGIGIGSPESDTRNIYRKSSSPEYSDEKSLVIGDIYWGTSFYFSDGKVNEIYIGATEE